MIVLSIHVAIFVVVVVVVIAMSVAVLESTTIELLLIVRFRTADTLLFLCVRKTSGTGTKLTDAPTRLVNALQLSSGANSRTYLR